MLFGSIVKPIFITGNTSPYTKDTLLPSQIFIELLLEEKSVLETISTKIKRKQGGISVEKASG